MHEQPSDYPVFFRVHNGEKIGSHDQIPQVGEVIQLRYATPHPESVDNIIFQNDQWAGVMRGDAYDGYQRVIVIRVTKSHQPVPDNSYDEKTDRDEVVIDEGVVEEVLTVDEFRGRYLKK